MKRFKKKTATPAVVIEEPASTPAAALEKAAPPVVPSDPDTARRFVEPTLRRARLAAVVLVVVAAIRGDVHDDLTQALFVAGGLGIAFIVSSLTAAVPLKFFRRRGHAIRLVIDAIAVGATISLSADTAILFVLLALPIVETALSFRALGATVVGYAGAVLLALHWLLLTDGTISADAGLDFAVSVLALGFVSIVMAKLTEELGRRLFLVDTELRAASVRTQMLLDLVESQRALATNDQDEYFRALLTGADQLGSLSSELHDALSDGSCATLCTSAVEPDDEITPLTEGDREAIIDADGVVVIMHGHSWRRRVSDPSLVAVAINLPGRVWLLRCLTNAGDAERLADGIEVLAAQISLTAPLAIGNDDVREVVSIDTLKRQGRTRRIRRRFSASAIVRKSAA